MNDTSPLLMRSWPYGTEKQAKVLLIHNRVRLRDDMTTRVVTVGVDDEAFVLIHEMAECKAGDIVTIVFLKGGITGGYWRIKQ